MQRKTSNSGASQHLPELMQLRHVRSVAHQYDIDLQGVSIKIERDANLINTGICGVANHEHSGKGRIHLLPDAFSSEEELARTLFHEKMHLEQFITHGYDNVSSDYARFEKETRQAEDKFWKGRHKE